MAAMCLFAVGALLGFEQTLLSFHGKALILIFLQTAYAPLHPH